MISLDDALAKIADNIQPVSETELCTLADALGRVLAEDIAALKSLPPFTNTGVDGYAFCHDGTSDFKIVGASYAGESFQGTLKKGEAARIATGAVLPDGADTVVMQEVCDVNGDSLHISEVPDKGSNIRHAGHDIMKGDTAISKGKKLSVQDIAMLGALGMNEIVVKRQLKIAVASTGMELSSPDNKGNEGTIVDTNTLMLSQMLQGQSVNVTSLPPVPDNYDATYESLKNAAKTHDVIVTTGGVSVGDRDFIRDVLHDHGKVLFWKIALRPGKPVLVAKLNNSIVIGLPGNPVSAFVTCHLIVKSVMRALNGQAASIPNVFSIPLEGDIQKPNHLRCFMRVNYSEGKATLYKDQSSNLYSSLTQATGMIDLPVGQSDFKSGDPVLYRPFSLFE